MPSSRRKRPYWRRAKPQAMYDIARLRPSTLARGERFETASDVRAESCRSEAMLRAHQRRNAYSTCLDECRNGHYDCEQTYCPKCARIFRRYLIGELLRLTSEANEKLRVLVVLLERSPRRQVLALDIERYRHSLRKGLERSGLTDVLVIGGFEMVYRARTREWLLHVNLVVFGGSRKAIDQFKDGFREPKAVQQNDLNDSAEQLSYVLKFTTYHR